MSSGFVSGGTVDQPIQRDDEWHKAQQEIEENRRRREAEGAQNGGKSLYEILQGNKAAKQEAFEESVRLKNQFRNLDEDEVEFLDSVLESTRRKEEVVRRDNAQQLEAFRRQREEVDKIQLDKEHALGVGQSVQGEKPEDESWVINKSKRKRDREKDGLGGLKIRKTSSAGERRESIDSKKPNPSLAPTLSPTLPQKASPAASLTSPKVASAVLTPKPKTAIGLVSYSSDEDE